MNFEEFSKIFLKELVGNDIIIEKNIIKKFYDYMNGILEWNEKNKCNINN